MDFMCGLINKYFATEHIKQKQSKDGFSHLVWSLSMFGNLNTRRSWRGYIFAVLVVICATAVRLLLLQSLELRTPYVIFFPSVTIAAAFGGFFPGLVAAVFASLMAIYFWMEPIGYFLIDSLEDAIGLGAFLVGCVVISFVCETMHRTQIELRDSKVESEERAKLLDFAHDYIMVRDLDSRIIYWNHGAELGYGFTADEAKGQIKNDFLQTEFPISAEDIMSSLLKHGYWHGELVHTGKDGKRIIVQSNQTINYDDIGNPVAVLEINHDITALNKAEAELDRLDRLNLVGEMAASIGHEVRNPMTTVRGYLQRFQMKEEFAEYNEQLGMMIEEIDRANGIITEFLSLAKNKSVEMKCGNLSNIVISLFPLLQADAFRMGHEIHTDISDIPDIYFDDKQIRQLILNLVRNALEAMEHRGIITIKIYQDKDSVFLAVQDTGIGIPDEVMDKLGTPFVTTKVGGTGLGLPVCYRIVDRHGAKIEVATSSEGTTFTIKFANKLYVKKKYLT